VVGATDAVLEQTEEPLDGLRVYVSVHVDAAEWLIRLCWYPFLPSCLYAVKSSV
jgi:hypothetical protein